ncbi:MAG: NAD(+)/NADH kinase [Chloroflexota bacterium]
MKFKRVGILGHPFRPETGAICDQVAQSLQARGIDTWQRSQWDATTISPLIAESDLVIAIGGDGAMLRAARLCAIANVPVFGINAGHLGFLTEASPATWESSVDVLLGDGYWIEERMMIHSEAWRNDTLLSREDSLNDVVVSRGSIARSVLLDLYIDNGWATTYNADGLIIATPTGSTAYGLAVGGPILPPELKNILVVPIAAHLSFDRPLVLSEGATVEIIVSTETQADVVLNVDGEHVTNLLEGDAVVVQASEYLSRFVRLRERNYFYRSILDRMEPRIPTRRAPEQRTRPLPGGNFNNHDHNR